VIVTEIARDRALLKGLPKSAIVDSEAPRLEGLLTDVEALMKAGRICAAVETLASASPGSTAIARAGSGWAEKAGDPGKTIDALTREWEDVGKVIARDRPKFAPRKPEGQSAFLRAIAEQSLGQIDEHYAVTVGYGRESGPSAGAYYLGRAEGQLGFALFVSGLASSERRKDRTPASLKATLRSLEDEIVSAYAKPGSTAQHANFITANSMLKLARELDQKGLTHGSLLTLMRSSFALALATLQTPDVTQEVSIAARLEEFEKHFAASTFDESIGNAYVEKARISLEKAHAGGEAGDRERLRAFAIATAVLPRYVAIMGDLK